MKTYLNRLVMLIAMLMGSIGIWAQPGPMPPRVVEGISSGHYFETICYPGTIISPGSVTSPFDIRMLSEVTFLAGESVHLKDGFSAHDFTSGYFHACTQAQDLTVLMEPASGNVPRFKRMELSIKLPQGMQDSITSFIDHYKAMYMGQTIFQYHWDYQNYIGMNPFNPDDISVEATFTSPGNQVKKVYGFFYEEQEYTGPVTDPATHWDSVYTPYPFRVRFCPDETGTWKCMVRINVDNAKFNLPDVNLSCEYEFQCAGSAEKGPLEAGNYGYLRHKADQSTFFPVGSYVGWANFRFDGNPRGTDNLNACLPYEYNDFNQILAGIKSAGANYVRLIPMASSWGIEMEDVNNYYRRMPHAWEFDKVVEYCEDNQIYFTMLLFRGGGDGNPLDTNDGHEFGWDSYGYNRQMFRPDPVYNQGFGPYTPLDPTLLYTEPQATVEYKKFLRYMTARWGYSSYMAQMEISSESDLIGQAQYNPPNVKYNYNPYHREITLNGNPSNFVWTWMNNYRFKPSTSWMYNGKTLARYIYEWHMDVADYLVNDLDIDRMVTTCYGAAPDNTQDPSFQMPVMATTSHHNYNYNGNKEIHKARFDLVQGYISAYRKPFLFEEIGENFYYDKTLPMDTSGPSFQNGVQLHSATWATSFSGAFGTTPAVVPGPLNYSSNNPVNDLIWHQKADSTLKFFQRTIPAVAAFFNGVDLNSQPYAPRYLDLGDLEAHILDRMDQRQAMGYIRMKQWYWATADNPPNSICVWSEDNGPLHFYDDDIWGPDVYQGAQIPSTPITNVSFMLPIYSGTYRIDWYDTWQPNTIVSSQVQSSTGLLQVNVPMLGFRNGNCPGCRQDLAFKIYPDGDHFRSMETEMNMETDTASFTIMPNPNDGNFTLSVYSRKPMQTQLHLLNIEGREVWSGVINLEAGMNMLSRAHTGLAPGIYLLRMDGINKVQRLVITGK